MRPMDFALVSESAARQIANKRQNAAMLVRFSMKGKGFIAEISAGRTDDVSVFREGTQVVVLATNSRLGYAGIEVFNTEGAKLSEFSKGRLEAENTDAGVFYQNEEDVREVLGPKGLELSEATIVRRLFDRCSSLH